MLDDAEVGLLIQTCDGVLWTSEAEWGDGGSSNPRKRSVGTKRGYVVEDEVSRLKARSAELEKRIKD